MAEPISIQQLKDASEDAISLAEFINKPENVMIPRRLASDIHSLQYYLEYMTSFAQRSYETYDEMIANSGNLSENVSVFVTNDLDPSKNGIYTYNGTSFVKGEYQPENAAKEFVESKLGGLEVFDGKVRAQDVSTSDGNTQDVKNTEFRNELDALPFVDGLLPSTKTTYLSSAIGAVLRSAYDRLSDTVSVKDFGAKGDGVTDDTIAINKAIAAMEGKTIDFPAGTYLYSELDNPAKAYSGWVGAGSGKTILKCTAVGGVALKIDAFPTPAITPFINGFTLRGMSILAPTAQVILELHGLARSMVGDIRLNGTDGSEGTIGLHWRGSQLSQTDSIYCTYEDGDVPETGILIEHGQRGVETIGSPSNNVFTNLYPEGSPYGIIMSSGDQNLFIGGSPESCTIRGLTIGGGCRYNTFISTGFENDYATAGDISDNGTYTRYINCYTSKGFEINGEGISIEGGIHEKVNITTAAIATTVKDITVAYWDTGGVVGGFTNNGKATRYQNIYNQKLGKYIHPFEDRYGVTVTASPFEWSNDTGVPVKIRTLGELEQVLVYRDTDFWVEVLPQDINKTGIYTLQAGEKIRIEYVTAPTFNVIPLNGL